MTVSNAAPVVDAGSDQTGINEGDTVNLAGSFTDVGTLDTHTFLWELVSGPIGVTVPDATTQTTSFVPTDDGSYVFRFTVTDDDNTFH